MIRYNLIEDLSNQLRLEYISDIKEPNYFEVILKAVAEIDATHYSLQNWEDLVTYITGEEYQADDCQQAKQKLVEVLKGK